MWSILGDGNLNQRCEIAHSRMRTQIELISTLSGPAQIEAFRALQISPEFLVQVQVAGEVMQFIATYLLMGGLTIYFAETRIKEEDR